ncbi:insulinase family protein [Erysipelotrichaceae bacterium OttesenSCG-928-M19]|nr:insulinase family protein [Erysipelotrichaceae bacterium OttesenSCG-928-M19]
MKTNYKIEQSNKFKTNFLQVRYLVEATKENISYASLLSMYLAYCNEDYPSYKLAYDKLDELYGAKFDISIAIKGNYITFDFHISFISQRFINDNNYLTELLKIFMAFILKPLINNNRFDQDIVALKKYELAERIKSFYDDKNVYAIERFLEQFAADYPLGLASAGYQECLDEIDERKLFAFYNDLLNQKPIICGMINSNDYDLVMSLLNKQFDKTNFASYFKMYNITNNESVKTVIEEQDIVQSKLVLGYTIDEEITSANYYHYLLINALFGMSSNSYLFKIVREQENLCYTIRSNYDQYSNTIIVFAGIEKESYEKTVFLVNDILEKMKHGNIEQENFEDAKTVMIDVINKLNNSQSGLVNYYLNRTMQKLNNDLSEDIKAIKQLELTDIIVKINNIKLKTVYLLSGDKNE